MESKSKSHKLGRSRSPMSFVGILQGVVAIVGGAQWCRSDILCVWVVVLGKGAPRAVFANEQFLRPVAQPSTHHPCCTSWQMVRCSQSSAPLPHEWRRRMARHSQLPAQLLPPCDQMMASGKAQSSAPTLLPHDQTMMRPLTMGLVEDRTQQWCPMIHHSWTKKIYQFTDSRQR